MVNLRKIIYSIYLAPIFVSLYLLSYWLPGSIDIALILLTIGSGFVLAFSSASDTHRTSVPDFLMILCAISYCLSIFYSGNFSLSLMLSAPFIPGVLLYLLLSRYVTDTFGLQLVFGSLALSVGMVAAMVLAGMSAHAAEPALLIRSLPTAILLVPNDVMLLSLCVPLILVIGLAGKTIFQIAISLLLVILCFAAIVVVNSRSALVAAVLASVTVVAFKGGRRLWVTLSGALTGLVATDSLMGLPMLAKLSQYQPLCDTRLPLWAAAVRLWQERPIFGYGSHSYRYLYQARIDATQLPACSLIDQRLTPWPHNLYLELLSSQGLLGLLPFATLLWWCVRSSYIQSRRTGTVNQLFAIGLFAALVAFGFAAFVELTFGCCCTLAS